MYAAKAHMPSFCARLAVHHLFLYIATINFYVASVAGLPGSAINF